MIPSHRTIQSLYQAVKLTHVIHITEAEFSRADELKNLQQYEFNGLVFFKACSQFWEADEDTGEFRVVHPIKSRDRVTFSIGVVAA